VKAANVRGVGLLLCPWTTLRCFVRGRYIRPRQTVSIASKQNMLFTVLLHVLSCYLQPCIVHYVMSCFDLCFWLVCLQLETKHVNTLFQSVFFCLPSNIHYSLHSASSSLRVGSQLCHDEETAARQTSSRYSLTDSGNVYKHVEEVYPDAADNPKCLITLREASH
jgi:hypothetical protein